MKKGASVVVFLCLLAFGIAAEGVTVSYVDGNAFVRRGAQWVPVAAGDSLSSEASLRLEKTTHVELAARGAKVVLNRAGTYSLGQILSARRSMDAAGVGSSLKAALAYMVRGPSLKRSTAMGVLGKRMPSDQERPTAAARQAEVGDAQRQAEVEGSSRADQGPPVAAAAPPPADFSGDEAGSTDEAPGAAGGSAGDDRAQSYLAEGKALIATGQYQQAVIVLTQALADATTEEMPEVRFSLAYASSQAGDSGTALALTDDLQPSGQEWAADLVILRAKLLVDASAYREEIQWLGRYGGLLSGDAERAPMYYFLLGLGYRGTGDLKRGNQNLSRVVSLSPTSELGTAAARLVTAR